MVAQSSQVEARAGRSATTTPIYLPRIGVSTEVDHDLGEIAQDVAPEAVLEQIEATEPRAKQN